MPIRCLIVERHRWETGGAEQQLQIPLVAANKFFGSGVASKSITIHVHDGSAQVYSQKCSVSKNYPNGTRRINGLRIIGSLPSCFIFFSESNTSGEYIFWWQEDKAIVAARYNNWQQAKGTQYGRGRLVSIQNVPVPRPIKTL